MGVHLKAFVPLVWLRVICVNEDRLCIHCTVSKCVLSRPPSLLRLQRGISQAVHVSLPRMHCDDLWPPQGGSYIEGALPRRGWPENRLLWRWRHHSWVQLLDIYDNVQAVQVCTHTALLSHTNTHTHSLNTLFENDPALKYMLGNVCLSLERINAQHVAVFICNLI